MNVMMVANATLQNLTRSIMLIKKFEKIQEEKINQDPDIGVHDDE